MTNVNVYTQIAKASSGVTSQTATALQGAGNGVLSGVSGNFWDLIMGGLGTTTTTADGSSTPEQTGSDNTGATLTSSSQAKTSPMSLLQLVLAAQGTDENGNIVLNMQDVDKDALETQLGVTNKLIEKLTATLPESGQKQDIIETLLGKLQTQSDSLRASLAALANGTISKGTPAEDLPFPLLIALGVSPAQIADVTENIKAAEEKLGRDITVEDLIAGVAGLIPPAPPAPPLPQDASLAASLSQNVDVNAAGNKADADATLDTDIDTDSSDDLLAARLNALSVGDEDAGIAEDAPLSYNKRLSDKLWDLPDSAKSNGADLAAQMKKAQGMMKDSFASLITGAKTQGDIIAAQTTLATSSSAAALGFSDAAGLSQTNSLQTVPGFSVGATTAAQAANIIASPASAGQSHPAAQLVSATLTKAGRDGSSDNMTIRLDPPELGTVSIRLEFGKDKSVKAHITVEKAETLSMLQKDSASLERALQNSGLQTAQDSLSFELSQNGGRFTPNGDGQNNNGANGNSRSLQNSGADDDAIRSSMTWDVDPGTGHIHYNIYA